MCLVCVSLVIGLIVHVSGQWKLIGSCGSGLCGKLTS
jgi:hypothetical protein